MARYPSLPYSLTNNDLLQMYDQVKRWSDILIQELDTRDIDVDSADAQTIFTVTTTTSIGRPVKGAIAYSTSTGKFKGYVSLGVETSWQDLN